MSKYQIPADMEHLVWQTGRRILLREMLPNLEQITLVFGCIPWASETWKSRTISMKAAASVSLMLGQSGTTGKSGSGPGTIEHLWNEVASCKLGGMQKFTTETVKEVPSSVAA